MGPDTELALALQSLDRKIIALKKEIATLPRHVAEIEKQLDSHRRRLEKDQAALTGNEKERRQMDADIKSSEEKISKLKNQMLDAKTNEQYRAFQHEISYCETIISKCEDRILELMEASEPLAAAVKTAEVALKREQAQVDLEKKVARDRTAKDEALLKEHLQERKRISGEMSPQLFTMFERIRKRYGYPAIAEGTNGKCSACNISLRPQFLQELRAAAEPLVCESCHRLLYYHPIVDVQAANDEPGYGGGTRVDMTSDRAK